MGRKSGEQPALRLHSKTKRRFFPRKVFQVPGPGKPCEDVFAFSLERNCGALCDGASDSYAGGTWARIVADGFAREGGSVRGRGLLPGFTSQRQREYERRLRQSHRSWSWYQQASYQRGSFTTLLGIMFFGGSRYAELVSIGDSLAVLLDGRRVVETFPFQNAAELDIDPVLLSTKPELNAFLRDSTANGLGGFSRQFARRLWVLKGLEHPSIILMSDALARWFLEDRQDRRIGRKKVEVLLSFDNQPEFADWVSRLQKSRELAKDDCTLVVMR